MVAKFELEFDKFADPRSFHRRQAMVMNRIAYRHSLRIEDTLLGQHDDFGFHRRGTLRDSEHPCQREISFGCIPRNCRVTIAARFAYRAA